VFGKDYFSYNQACNHYLCFVVPNNSPYLILHRFDVILGSLKMNTFICRILLVTPGLVGCHKELVLYTVNIFLFIHQLQKTKPNAPIL